MLTDKQIQDHLMLLALNFDSKSPFKGTVDLYSKGGLMTLPLDEQLQIHDAMCEELKGMVFGEYDEIPTY